MGKCTTLNKLILTVGITTLVILLIVGLIADINLIIKSTFHEEIDKHILHIHAASIIILTIALIYVGWQQLENLNRTSSADFLLRIDNRYSNPEIIKARIIIQQLYRKTTSPEKKYSEDDVTKKIADEIKLIGRENSNESCEKFIYLLNLLDFLETISYFSNRNFVNATEIDNLLGNTILFNYKIFKYWIKYRREKYQQKDYYSELQTLVEKIDPSFKQENKIFFEKDNHNITSKTDHSPNLP